MIYIGSFYFDAPIFVDLIYYFFNLPMRLQTIERYYFFSDFFEKYPFMTRKNILDTIIVLKILYFYVTILLSKLIRRDNDNRHL